MTTRLPILTLAAFFVLTLLAARAPAAEITPPVVYNGIWKVHDNGDVTITCTFKLTLQGYLYFKEHNVAMLAARNFSPSRAGAELTDLKAEWDDIQRILKLTMTGKGFAQNRGDHWELRIADIQFSNIDTGTKTAHFSMENDGPMGHIVGHDQLVLPAASTKPAWDASSHMITYQLPTPYPSRFSLTLTLALIAAALTLLTLGLSFLPFASRSHTPPSLPATPPQ